MTTSWTSLPSALDRVDSDPIATNDGRIVFAPDYYGRAQGLYAAVLRQPKDNDDEDVQYTELRNAKYAQINIEPLSPSLAYDAGRQRLIIVGLDCAYYELQPTTERLQFVRLPTPTELGRGGFGWWPGTFFVQPYLHVIGGLSNKSGTHWFVI